MRLIDQLLTNGTTTFDGRCYQVREARMRRCDCKASALSYRGHQPGRQLIGVARKHARVEI
jgi:hypothetical protein